MQIRLLGDYGVVAGGQPIATLNTPRLRSLLAYLILHRDVAQTRQHIAFLFWPDSSEEQAQTNLRNLFFVLRHALPEFEKYISFDRHTLQWKADAYATLDVDEFESVSISANPQPATDQVSALLKVVDLYRGDLLPGCYDEWILVPRERLRQRFLEALQKLIEVLQRTGDLATAILYAQLLLRHDPLQEQNYRQLMSLHLANGDGVSALNVYQQCERVLRHELRVHPSPATHDLARKAKAFSASDPGDLVHDGPGGKRDLHASPPSRAPSHESVSGARHPGVSNLPAQTTAFIGREREVVEISEQLRMPECRLMTLTGTAGTGKTRLALQVASGLSHFRAGVFFVPLAPLAEPDMVEGAIADVLGVTDSAGRSLYDALLNHLHDKETLLVLDNFEHLLPAAGLVAELLAHCRHVKVLATSRAPLNLRGEYEHIVPPLSIPGRDAPTGPDELAQYESVALFAARALEVFPQFALTRESARAVAEICRRLEGLPLAIELAAARVKVLSPGAISSRLDRRLKLLVGGKADLPKRQQTLEAAIAWSYNLLDRTEQALFRGLGVFSGGCTLEAVEAVVGRNLGTDHFLDLMTGLVNKSLLARVEADIAGTSPRFVMLETLREYALQKLRESGEDDPLRGEHALYYVGAAEEAEPHLTGPKQVEWFNRLEVENDNFRAALRWAEDARAGESKGASRACEIALRLVGSLWRLWLFRGPVTEGREQIERVLALVQEKEEQDGGAGRSSQVYLAKALFGAGSLAYLQDDNPAARAFTEQSLNIRRKIGDKQGIVHALQMLGFSAQVEGDSHLARSLYKQTLAMAQELGNEQATAFSLFHLGELAQKEGDYDSARSLYEQSSAVGEKIGDGWALAHALSKLGWVAQAQGDYASARSLYERALSLARDLGHRGGIAEIVGYMGSLAFAQGDFASARPLYKECLGIQREIGDRGGIAFCLTGLGALAAIEAVSMPPVEQEQRAQIGARLLGIEEMVLEALGTPYPSLKALAYEQGVQAARQLLGETGFAKAHAEGLAMTLEEALLLVENLG